MPPESSHPPRALWWVMPITSAFSPNTHEGLLLSSVPSAQFFFIQVNWPFGPFLWRHMYLALSLNFSWYGSYIIRIQGATWRCITEKGWLKNIWYVWDCDSVWYWKLYKTREILSNSTQYQSTHLFVSALVNKFTRNLHHYWFLKLISSFDELLSFGMISRTILAYITPCLFPCTNILFSL